MPALLLMLLVFSVTIFLSATLLFLIEPMVGKLILPMLGGTPAVWNTCMVFFQAILLAGYAYAHATTAWLGVRKQAALHLLIMLVPFFFFPLTVNANLIQANTDNPIPGLLLLLTVSFGVPFFVVSTTAPVISKWFADTDHPSAHDPYFLYGASNLGSMIALLGYPVIVEPNLYLATQRAWWGVGYGLLVLVTGACALLLWRSRPAPALNGPGFPVQPPAPQRTDGVTLDSPGGPRRSDKTTKMPRSAVALEKAKPMARAMSERVPEVTPLSTEVTWLRRLRWVALAAVPSSLMLGATTYITTDIAAIPLLWVGPLAIYLLTFIIVFSRAPAIVHKAHVLAMPLMVLLLLFLTLSEWKPKGSITYAICFHLVTLYAVAMVCHGELARSRPSTAHLTEYFLWMSFGGVVGGLFNALFAPLVFNSIIEYQIALVLACLLAPSLGEGSSGAAGVLADAGLVAAFAITGLALTWFRYHSGPVLDYEQLGWSSLKWDLVGLLLVVALGALGLVRAWRHRQNPEAAVLDLALPISLGILAVGLQLGLPSKMVEPRVRTLIDMIPERARPGLGHLRLILMYGLPAVLCYTFIERSLRFGLSVAMLLIASSVCGVFNEDTLFQKRSFFGVLKVERRRDEDGNEFNRLIHGTTLHGEQFVSEELRDEALTYYHRTGPVGQVLEAYSGPNVALGAIAGAYTGYAAWPELTPNIGVIGLGTGTLASYARPGQNFTFYDIDAVVRDISFNSREYFTYVDDARRRYANIQLVLGDARLTLDRNPLAEHERYGVLIVDAFSSDAIPMHLINREALRMFLNKITKDGIICFHISNRHLDLEPVLANLCQDAGLIGYLMSDNNENYVGKSASTWVAIARKEEDLARLMTDKRWKHEQAGVEHELCLVAGLPDGGTGLSSLAAAIGAALPYQNVPWKPVGPKESFDPDTYLFPGLPVGVWTDDYSNILSVFTH